MMPDNYLDKTKVRHSFAAAAQSYDAAALLQRQVGELLLHTFPLQPQPGIILDLGCGTGFLTRQLAAGAINGQDLLAVDIALPMLAAARQKNAAIAPAYVCADAEQLPFAAASLQQIYTNLALQWCQNLSVVFADSRRALQPGGQLAFSTFGPATLQELKTAWRAVDSYTHVNELDSSQQIEHFLTVAGFRDMVSHTRIYQSAYPSVMALMRELKDLGAHNVNSSRNRQVTSRRQLQEMIKHYESWQVGQQIIASYEIIFVRALV